VEIRAARHGAALAVGAGTRDRADQPEERGAELTGQQVGLVANVDLSGLAITSK
jgi:hypothetical protein